MLPNMCTSTETDDGGGAAGGVDSLDGLGEDDRGELGFACTVATSASIHDA